MGTTADKLSYLNTTKTQIKESINLTNINITNEPFRYYAYAIKKGIINVLNDPKAIWNNFEKVTGEGTFIELTSTENAPIEIKLKGNTNQAGEPTPDNPIEINVVSGDNTIVVEGKNLLPITNQDFTIKNVRFKAQSNGHLLINGTASGLIAGSDFTNDNYIPMTLQAGSYTFSRSSVNSNVSIGLVLGNGSTTLCTLGRASSALSVSFMVNATTKCYLFAYITSGSVVDNYDVSLMVEKGSTATSYVPHQEYTKEINLGNLEVGSIGDYDDEFFKNTTDSEYYDSSLELDKWYLKKRIGKVVLNGSEDWNKLQTLTNTITFQTTNIPTNAKLNIASELNYLSDKFIKNNNYSLDSEHFYINNNGKIVLFINSSRLSGTSVNDFITWLSTHNTIVYYVLATPTNTEITDSTLISQLEKTLYSYSGQTNISQINNDLPFILDVKALKLIE